MLATKRDNTTLFSKYSMKIPGCRLIDFQGTNEYRDSFWSNKRLILIFKKREEIKQKPIGVSTKRKEIKQKQIGYERQMLPTSAALILSGRET